ncbi:unnamed protein product, partial [Prorocentrum cordatum]
SAFVQPTAARLQTVCALSSTTALGSTAAPAPAPLPENRDPPRPPLGLPTFAERAAWGILQVRAFDGSVPFGAREQRDNNGIKKHTNLGRFARSSRICAVPPSAAR